MLTTRKLSQTKATRIAEVTVKGIRLMKKIWMFKHEDDARDLSHFFLEVQELIHSPDD